MWDVVAFLSGVGLGLLHLKSCEKAVLGLLSSGDGSRVRRKSWASGAGRHLFTFVAGFCLCMVARFDPFHLCGGLFAATVLYRIAVLRGARAQLKEIEVT